jgi:3-oxoacyl-[acyl-carrier-protein] synthase II
MMRSLIFWFFGNLARLKSFSPDLVPHERYFRSICVLYTAKEEHAMNRRPDIAVTRPRVVITGLGALTPLGLTAEETWQGLLAGRSGIARITSIDLSECTCQIGGELKGFDPRTYLGAKGARRMARFSQLAVIAAQMALEDADLALSDEEKEDAGVLLGTAIGGTVTETEAARSSMDRRGFMRVSPFHLTAMPPNMAAFHVAETTGFHGHNSTTVTACAAGAQAIGDAGELIRSGRAQVVLTGGTEAAISPTAFASFAVMNALSTRNGDPAAASRPFDAQRDGFLMSEGAAIFVLESLDHALQRGARIHAELVGYAANSDGYHAIAPNPEPTGPIKAMRQALADAGLEAKDIDAINTHGTATPLGDVAETQAIKAVFGERAYRLPVTANKSMLGHGLGAAGAMETLACVLSIRDNRIPPTINLDYPDPECDLDYVPHTARAASIDVVLKNSFGMGNQNACLVLKRFVNN